MNIAIIHYHLTRGGVTQVVLNHLWSVDWMPDEELPNMIVLMHGGRREGFPEDLSARLPRFRIIEVVIPGLDYDEGSTAKWQPVALADQIESALRENGCAPADTLLHIHNHALGKNVSLPGAVSALADRQFGILLQTHDFAEDFRPANYRRLREAIAPQDELDLPGLLYPQASQIHYAVLNRRDWSVLRQAGIDERQLHLLPNAASTPAMSNRSIARKKISAQFGIGADESYVLYPVRGIRRKNLGEALLWAAVAKSAVGSSTVFGFTLPPLNPLEQPSYARWRCLASELGLRCRFEVGGPNGLSLDDNLAACDGVLTTSLAEGFGMVFLETWLADRLLVGRDLPEVTSDFVQYGMKLAGLRSRIDVPMQWIGRPQLLEMLARSYNSTLESYGCEPLSLIEIDEGLEAKLSDDCIDFGDLDADLQEKVVRKVCSDRVARDKLVEMNPFLSEAFPVCVGGKFAEVEHNANVVRERYSLEVSSRQLAHTYERVMSSPRGPVGGLRTGERILDFFLSLPRFRPVRL